MFNWLLIILATVVIDQVTKMFAVRFLTDGESFDVISGVLRFTYVENRGAAFGMLSDNRWVFMVISVIAIVALLIYLWRFRPDSVLACLSISFIIGGGIGNMIDRIFLGYVVDFIDFCAFPNLWVWVFNMADAFVCVGGGMLMLWLILSLVADVKKEKAQKLAGVEAKSDESSENEQDSADGK